MKLLETLLLLSHSEPDMLVPVGELAWQGIVNYGTETGSICVRVLLGC